MYLYATSASAPRPTTARTVKAVEAEAGARADDRADACSQRWPLGCDMARSCRRVCTLSTDAAAALLRCDGVVECGRHAVTEAVDAVHLVCCHIATHITST